ncbi:MAG TPA: hypothetical protein VHW01_14340 [Polyangiaceae bacterium]|jgi:hypothetical protein|nr:hypothetical protein [Polyangiaceae bacterium]
MALTVSARSRWTGPSTPALIRGAALCAAAGIFLSLTEYADTGKWLAVVGVVLLIVGLHRFGRTGPDEPIRFELAPPRKKKKKKKKAASVENSEGEPPDGDGNAGSAHNDASASNDTNEEPGA